MRGRSKSIRRLRATDHRYCVASPGACTTVRSTCQVPLKVAELPPRRAGEGRGAGGWFSSCMSRFCAAFAQASRCAAGANQWLGMRTADLRVIVSCRCPTGMPNKVITPRLSMVFPSGDRSNS